MPKFLTISLKDESASINFTIGDDMTTTGYFVNMTDTHRAALEVAIKLYREGRTEEAIQFLAGAGFSAELKGPD